MTTNNGHTSPRLSGCDVLPPMEPGRPPEQSPRQRKQAKGATGDRFKVLNAFIDFTLRTLRRNESAAWLVLYRDTKNGTARTSIADIARRSGTSPRTALRAVAELERRGLLRIVHRGGLRRGVSIYRVLPLEPQPPRLR
jgi:hypothetical protein